MLLVGITGDRGLCGGYNTYAIKKIETRAAELKAQGIDFDMICIGNKGNTYLRKRYNVIGNYAIGNAPTADEATAISDSLLASYLAGDCDRVELLCAPSLLPLSSSCYLASILALSGNPQVHVCRVQGCKGTRW